MINTFYECYDINLKKNSSKNHQLNTNYNNRLICFGTVDDTICFNQKSLIHFKFEFWKNKSFRTSVPLLTHFCQALLGYHCRQKVLGIRCRAIGALPSINKNCLGISYLRFCRSVLKNIQQEITHLHSLTIFIL